MNTRTILSSALASLVLALPLATHAAVPAGGAPAALPLTDIAGGAMVDPVLSDELVYVASGRILTTWDYTDPAAPVRIVDTAETPMPGVVRGLTRWRDHLYASWQSGDDSAGVAVFSLRNPRRPELVNTFSDYSPNGLKNLWTLAAAGGYLYLFDAENGIFFGDVATNSQHPTFTRLSPAFAVYERSQVIGDHLYVSGRATSLNSPNVCTVFDVSTPSAPVAAGSCSASGADSVDYFRTRVQPPLAVTFGAKFSLFDLSNPAQAVQLASVDNPASRDGFIHGDYAYGLGFEGIDIHDISDPTAPSLVAHADILTLGTDSVTPVPGGAFVLASTDRLLRLDVTDPRNPVEASVATPRGGSVPNDIAIVNGRAVILQENYGLGIADRETLEPVARLDTSLPQQLNKRDFEQFAVDGNRAYLAAWGTGLVIVDLGNPDRPRELSMLPFEFASSVAASGDFAYVGTATNGGRLQIVDVSDPSRPAVRSETYVSTINRLQIHGDYLYVADELTGLRVFDVSDKAAPQQVALHDEGCMGFGGASFDVELSPDGRRAYLACETGLQILDLSRPGSPVKIGGWDTQWASGATITARGDRVWFADTTGVKEFDISDETRPQLVGDTPIVWQAPRRLRALEDGRVFAFMRQAGLHVFGTVTSEPLPPHIFSDEFEGEPLPAVIVTDFEALTEGFMGPTFSHNGITFREVNQVAGVFPDGEPFEAGSDDLGGEFIIEDATYLFNDFPDFGSPFNTMTFGTTMVEGQNLTIGPMSSAWFDLDAPAVAAELDLVFYEYGPWEGIEIRLDGVRDGKVVATASLVLGGNGDPLERDRLGMGHLRIEGAAFDSLNLSAWLNGQYTAPRVMIDDLVIQPAQAPAAD